MAFVRHLATFALTVMLAKWLWIALAFDRGFLATAIQFFVASIVASADADIATRKDRHE